MPTRCAGTRDQAAVAVERAAALPAARPSEEPRYSPDELAGVVPIDYRKPYDVREVIARIVDDSELPRLQGRSMFARPSAARRSSRARLSASSATTARSRRGLDQGRAVHPAVRPGRHAAAVLQNTTGFMVGTRRGAARRDQARLQDDPSGGQYPGTEADLDVGASYGAGNYAMCGRGLDPRFIFAWPNSRTAVMGGARPAKCCASSPRRSSSATAAGRCQEARRHAGGVVGRMEKQSTALYASASLWDDGLIDPRDTRTLLGYALDICHEAEVRPLQANRFGVARF